MEESGWKNVHGDVFRPPQYPMILSSLLGSGIQLFCMILIVICEFVSSDTSSYSVTLEYSDYSACCSCCHVGDVVSVQPRSLDDHRLLPLHVHGVRPVQNPPRTRQDQPTGSDLGLSPQSVRGLLRRPAVPNAEGPPVEEGGVLCESAGLGLVLVCLQDTHDVFSPRRRLCTPRWSSASASSSTASSGGSTRPAR